MVLAEVIGDLQITNSMSYFCRFHLVWPLSSINTVDHRLSEILTSMTPCSRFSFFSLTIPSKSFSVFSEMPFYRTEVHGISCVNDSTFVFWVQTFSLSSRFLHFIMALEIFHKDIPKVLQTCHMQNMFMTFSHYFHALFFLLTLLLMSSHSKCSETKIHPLQPFLLHILSLLYLQVLLISLCSEILNLIVFLHHHQHLTNPSCHHPLLNGHWSAVEGSPLNVSSFIFALKLKYIL